MQQCVAIFAKNDVTEVKHLANIKNDDIVYEAPTSAGKKGVINGAIAMFAKLQKAQDGANVCSSSSSAPKLPCGFCCVCAVLPSMLQGLEATMAGAFEKALGVRPKEFVHVNIDAKLTEAGLATHFPCESWPPTTAVNIVHVLSGCNQVVCCWQGA